MYYVNFNSRGIKTRHWEGEENEVVNGQTFEITEFQYNNIIYVNLIDNEIVFDTEAYNDSVKAELDKQMLEIDIKSIRSIRAYILGEQTEDDTNYLTKHKNDVAALRSQRNNL